MRRRSLPHVRMQTNAINADVSLDLNLTYYPVLRDLGREVPDMLSDLSAYSAAVASSQQQVTTGQSRPASCRERPGTASALPIVRFIIRSGSRSSNRAVFQSNRRERFPSRIVIRRRPAWRCTMKVLASCHLVEDSTVETGCESGKTVAPTWCGVGIPGICA